MDVINLIKNELDRELIYIQNAKSSLITAQEIISKVLNNNCDFIKYKDIHLPVVNECNEFYRKMSNDFVLQEKNLKKLIDWISTQQNK